VRVVRGISPGDSDGNGDGVGQKVRHVRATEYERNEEETLRWGYEKRWLAHMGVEKGSGRGSMTERITDHLSDQDHLQEGARGLLMARGIE